MANGSNRAIGTSAVRLTAMDIPVRGKLRLKAAAGNGGIVYVGGEGVTASTDAGLDGWPLSAGQDMELTPAEFAQTSEVWLIGSAGTQIVYWHSDYDVSFDVQGWAADFSVPEDSGLLLLL